MDGRGIFANDGASDAIFEPLLFFDLSSEQRYNAASQ
jgi:hypothetical protein